MNPRGQHGPVSAAGDLSTRPAGEAPPALVEGPFRVTFAEARSAPEEVRRAQRLRYEVFNLELAEGLAESASTGLDQDEFDGTCHHLMVEQLHTGTLVGTYRMQRAATASKLYCAQEFDLRALEPEVLAKGVELGRACIDRAHRHGLALFALWRGLAAYAAWSGSRYFFGCSSLTSQDETLAWRVHDDLAARGYRRSGAAVRPWPSHACLRVPGGDEEALPPLPTLFGTYLRYGAKVCGPPAIDRAFGTIDFLVVLDLEDVAPRLRRLFFDGLEPPGGVA